MPKNTEETEPEVTTRTLYTTSKVNIRKQPNTDCAVLGKAESGQEVIEYEAGADGWSRVACGGVEGYIKSEFLTQEAPNTATTQAAEPTASVAVTEPVQNTPAPVQEATDKDTSDYKELTYEGYGPFGIAIFVEAATDNNTRTVANVRSYFTKYGGTLGTSGSLSFLFTRKAVFTVKAKEGVDMEELELELIDFGVDELYLDEEENTITAYGEPDSYAQLQSYFEENGYELVSAEFVRIPNDTKEVTEEQRVTLDKLLDKFDEDEDVTAVYHNIKETEE